MRAVCYFCPVLLLVGLASGCTPDESDRFTAVTDVQGLMVHVLEPAAEEYWDAVGWIVDESGTTEIRPASVEEWERVLNAAYVVAESGNLLMMDERAVDQGSWIRMSQEMIDVGRRAIEAAEARNEAAVFDVGAEVYFTCTNCHSTYAVETLRPNVRVE